MNSAIRSAEVRVVDHDGTQVGVIPLAVALARAEEIGLDLVEIAPTAVPPVCKIIDYSKFLYEAEQKKREARRNTVRTNIKEMKLRLKIDTHDLATKRGHITKFLNAGDKVKVTVMFRGRENTKPELGLKLLEDLMEDLTGIGIIESGPTRDGRNMIIMIVPAKKAPEPGPTQS